MDPEIKALGAEIERESLFARRLLEEVGKVIVGQQAILERMLVGLLADGHILIEGVPGLAKTLAVKTLSDCIRARFQRLQFTPDLLPADLIGTTIYNPQGGQFTVKKGPIFANLILADEINRAPAKVQSALLEAMQERQVTIGDQTFPLESPFLVMATQNPIEQEGTYPLPEAQVDRFMLKLKITYPNRNEEARILERMAPGASIAVSPVADPVMITTARALVNRIYLDEKIRNYILDLILATRRPADFNLADMERLILYGASPRATIYLARAARALAFLQGRGFVTPDDVKALAPDILRHRIIITYEAEAEELTSDDLISRLLSSIEVP